MSVVRRILLIVGAPFGVRLFEGVHRRMAAEAPELDVQISEDVSGDFSGAVVVAHGLALPEVIAKAAATPPELLVLSNGPISRFDPVSSLLVGLSAAPGLGALAQNTLFQGAPWLAALRSSLALRRLVNNPYVMDRDTVAAICGGAVDTGDARIRLRKRLASLSGTSFPQALPSCPVAAIWGDNDRLYPPFELDLLASNRTDLSVSIVPGGRFLHPFEQPWSFADALIRLARTVPEPSRASATEGSNSSPTTASMSRTHVAHASGPAAAPETMGVLRA